jgi:hypothetical protein
MRLGYQGVDTNRGQERFVTQDFVIHCKEYDSHVWHPALQQGRHLHTVHVRHSKVQDNQAGLQFACFFKHIIAVYGFATNFKIAPDKVGTNGSSKKPAIVRDQYTVGHGGLENTTLQTLACSPINEHQVLYVSDFGFTAET